MAKRRGATARDPKYTTQPVKGGAEQVARDTGDMRMGTKTPEQIDRAARRAANRAPTERLSPGVYRSAGGGLVTQQGRPIQRQPQQGMAQQIAGNPWAQGGQVEQIAGQQTNKPYQMDGQYNPDLQQTTASAQQLIGQMGQGNFDASTIGKTPPGYFQGQIQDAMYRVPNLPQMPQASANMGGQYRLSPGVYGTREQAMQQYNQQLQGMAMQGANQAMPDQGGGGPGNFIGQQRARELGYVENRFDAARNNNLFRGNPIRRFGF